MSKFTMSIRDHTTLNYILSSVAASPQISEKLLKYSLTLKLSPVQREVVQSIIDRIPSFKEKHQTNEISIELLRLIAIDLTKNSSEVCVTGGQMLIGVLESYYSKVVSR